jgi:hypothetical protein
VSYPFTYSIQMYSLKPGFSFMSGMLFDGDMDDVIDEMISVDVDGEYLVIKGTKQKQSPNFIVTDGTADIIQDLPTS